MIFKVCKTTALLFALQLLMSVPMVYGDIDYTKDPKPKSDVEERKKCDFTLLTSSDEEPSIIEKCLRTPPENEPYGTEFPMRFKCTADEDGIIEAQIPLTKKGEARSLKLYYITALKLRTETEYSERLHEMSIWFGKWGKHENFEFIDSEPYVRILERPKWISGKELSIRINGFDRNEEVKGEASLYVCGGK